MTYEFKDFPLSMMYHEWIEVEIVYPSKCMPEGDASISTVYTEKRLMPKDIDSKGGFKTYFPAKDYESATRYARKMCNELAILAIL